MKRYKECSYSIDIQVVLNEKSTANCLVFKICCEDDSFDDEIANTTYPRLIGTGELGSLDPLVIATEGQIFLNLSKKKYRNFIVYSTTSRYILCTEYGIYTKGLQHLCPFGSSFDGQARKCKEKGFSSEICEKFGALEIII
ncbi:uncharacterized protein LOC124450612 [Xenia sp. Carnegie-2017]|uniref:uncharacterized protein LOC124450612 n=1 Tax=Xenia sp. Carnegie-2017 TaxID=2897299 RepID=UPI001F0458BC|nr:uncharacterized protein LOC124450612 [Xenia sp. Carnegie-2017]